MRTAEEIVKESIVNSFKHSIDPFEVYESMIKVSELAVNIARKEAAIEFFKWNAKHISEYLDYLRRVDSANGTSDYEREMDFYEKTTIENRYKEFENSINKLQ